MTQPTLGALARQFVDSDGHQVTVPLSGDLTATGCEILFELLTVLLGVGFDVEVRHSPPTLTIGRKR